MYRETRLDNDDLECICNIYNTITGRSRTPALHKWEWFASPYKNKSYVITNGSDEVLGHHGILGIRLRHNGQVVKAGKTENTIMIPGQGAIYFKNEKAMLSEYAKDFDVLITTAAYDVLIKIRRSLGYRFFAKYIHYVYIADFTALLPMIQRRINNKFFCFLAKYALAFSNLFVFKRKIGKEYKFSVSALSESDLNLIEDFHNKTSEDIKISQLREAAFLRYRLLENPYSNFNIIKLTNGGTLRGVLVFREKDGVAYIDDILFSEQKDKKELLKIIVNRAIERKLGLVRFWTLEGSLLDRNMPFFIRLCYSRSSSCFMIRTNLPFNVEDFYITPLFNEGIG